MTTRERAWFLSGRFDGFMVPAKLKSNFPRKNTKKGTIVLCYPEQFDKEGKSDRDVHVARIPDQADFEIIRKLPVVDMHKVLTRDRKYNIGGFDNFPYRLLELLK